MASRQLALLPRASVGSKPQPFSSRKLREVDNATNHIDINTCAECPARLRGSEFPKSRAQESAPTGVADFVPLTLAKCLAMEGADLRLSRSGRAPRESSLTSSLYGFDGVASPQG